MKSFIIAAAPKRTLSSFRGVKSNGEARNGFRGMSSCLSSSLSSAAGSNDAMNDDTKLQQTRQHRGFLLSPSPKREQTRYYTVMGRNSALKSYPTWMVQHMASPFTQGLSVRNKNSSSDDKKKTDDDDEDVDEDEATLPPPIPGDNGEEDLEFEDPNEEKHAPEDLDGDRANFTVPIVINMPDMNDDNLISTIEKWYKEPGDIIKRNDILCDITTPDFTFGMVTEDDSDAIMGEHHVKEGESAKDNEPICTIYHEP